MKILIITYNYAESASGIISRRMSEALAAKGNEVKVICSNRPHSTYDKVEVHTINSIFTANKFASRLCGKLKRTGAIYFYDFWWVKAATKFATQICKEWNPDFVYCRTSPEEACYVGTALKKRFGVKVAQHFADPIPAPFEYEPQSRRRRQLAKMMYKVVESADIVSYGNQAMHDYALEQIGYDFSPKSIISPDAGSCGQMRKCEFVESNEVVMTFLGNIYGNRKPQNLYKAIEVLNRAGYNITMQIFAERPHNESTDYNFIKYRGYTRDIDSALEQSDILVDIDGDDLRPVFISSKLKDYLLINRPILSITPANSPSEQILKGINSVVISRNQGDAIEEAIRTILDNDYKSWNYDDRSQLIDMFNPTTVADNLLSALNKLSSYEK